MKKLTLILVLSTYAIVFGQRTVQFADSIRKSYKIPEISYAVVDFNSTLEIAAIGRHSIELPDTSSLNDRFHIGSNTKAMTAFIIAKYVEEGKLKWTTKFFDIFPEWMTECRTHYANITIADLLSHKAGIQAFQGDDDIKIPEFEGTSQVKRTQFGQFVLTLDPVKLNEQMPFSYSNAGYTLASLMLEKVSGKTWEQLVEMVLNKDLKLNVQFSWPENQKRKDTWGHWLQNDTLKAVPSTIDYHLDYTEPAGDLNIKLTDYIKFVQLNLHGLKGQNNYLKADTYNFIHKGIKNYSIGWYNIYENGNDLSTHSGTAGTYYSLVHIDRLKNRAYIIFTNSFNTNTQQGVRLLMRELKENYGFNIK